MIYSGLVRVVGLKYRKPVFDADSFENLRLFMDVLIKTGEEVTKLVTNLKFDMGLDGDTPDIGDVMWVIINNDRVKTID